MADRRALPPPATQADEYLHDIAASLRQLVDMLAQTVVEVPAADGDDEVVALREPEPPAKPKRRTRDQK